jgi:hypothetical protein
MLASAGAEGQIVGPKTWLASPGEPLITHLEASLELARGPINFCLLLCSQDALRRAHAWCWMMLSIQGLR